MMANAGKNMRKPPPVKNQLREEIVIRNADSGKGKHYVDYYFLLRQIFVQKGDCSRAYCYPYVFF